jgi:hypothetical protein
MPSLNQLSSNVAHLLKHPFDSPLKERIKDDYRNLRALYLRRSIEKGGIDDVLKVSYELPLISVDKVDNCLTSVGCLIKRTENPVGKPVRYKTDVPFTFVGTPDGFGFTYIKQPREVDYRKYLKHVADAILYSYINNYIYVYNDKIANIRIDGVPENPEFWITICNDSCYNDNMEFPLPRDIIFSITTDIYKMYGVKIIEENIDDSNIKMNVGDKENVR